MCRMQARTCLGIIQTFVLPFLRTQGVCLNWGAYFRFSSRSLGVLACFRFCGVHGVENPHIDCPQRVCQWGCRARLDAWATRALTTAQVGKLILHGRGHTSEALGLTRVLAAVCTQVYHVPSGHTVCVAHFRGIVPKRRWSLAKSVDVVNVLVRD